MTFSVLGVHISTITKRQALQTARDFLFDGKQHAIFTPNPEMVVKAQTDEYFKKVLNTADLSLCDGFGLWLAVQLSSRGNRGISVAPLSQRTDISRSTLGMTERITGVDFMVDVCRLAEEGGKSVFLLGSESDEVAKKTAEVLTKKFPKLKIVGVDKGVDIEEKRYAIGDSANIAYSLSPMHLNYNEQQNQHLLDKINATKPDILFVAFGMGKQEKWIYENLSKMPSAKIAMGVGGAFDFISGNVPRAPLLMRKIGLEWLYRLVKQPQRIGRIGNATVKFVYYYVKDAFHN